jgi:hypothetical protein
MELYRGYPSTRYSLSYSVKERYAGNEIMFFSKALNLPEVSNPARVKKSDLNNSMLQQQL